MAAYRRVYDSRHLQTDCQEPGSAPERYARNRVWATFTFLKKLSDNSSFLYLAACFKCIAWTRPIATDELAWSECVCVCFTSEPCKTSKPIGEGNAIDCVHPSPVCYRFNF